MHLKVGLIAAFAASTISVGAADLPIAPAPTQIKLHSPIVTGNGFGYAVLATNGEISKLYAHPYRFLRANKDLSKDGPSTANFVKSMTWVGKGSPAQKPEVSYVAESQIMSVKANGNEYDYFMPFGLKRNALIALHKVADGADADAALRVTWLHPIETENVKEISGYKVRLLKFKDVDEALAVVSLDKSKSPDASSTSIAGNACAFLVLENAGDLDKAVAELLAWKGELSNDALVQREIKSLDEWRKAPTVHFVSEQEKKLWRQSETILRMAQIQEENTSKRFNHGLILAALPDGVWFTAWVRDMSYALVGLTLMGHEAEAREGIMSWFNARPMGQWKHETNNLDYQISVVRYYGDGSEEADYSGQKTANVEFDDWGLALWAISEYWEKTHDDSLLSEQSYRGKVYDVMRDFIVKPLIGNMDPYKGGLIVGKDSSCWEEHQENKKHFVCSTIAAIRGLQGFLKIAEHMHDEPTVKLVTEKLKLLDEGFKAAYIKDGAVWGTVEECPKSEIDGAVLETFNWDIVKDPAVIDKTLSKMERLKTASGGYRRNTGPSTYEAHQFLLIDFNYARLLFKLGKTAEAARMLATLVDKSCQDNGLIAEMYVSQKDKDYVGEIGDPAGAIPMVGFGAGDYVLTLSDRDRYAKH